VQIFRFVPIDQTKGHARALPGRKRSVMAV